MSVQYVLFFLAGRIRMEAACFSGVARLRRRPALVRSSRFVYPELRSFRICICLFVVAQPACSTGMGIYILLGGRADNNSNCPPCKSLFEVLTRYDG